MCAFLWLERRTVSSKPSRLRHGHVLGVRSELLCTHRRAAAHQWQAKHVLVTHAKHGKGHWVGQNRTWPHLSPGDAPTLANRSRASFPMFVCRQRRAACTRRRGGLRASEGGRKVLLATGTGPGSGTPMGAARRAGTAAWSNAPEPRVCFSRGDPLCDRLIFQILQEADAALRVSSKGYP